LRAFETPAVLDVSPRVAGAEPPAERGTRHARSGFSAATRTLLLCDEKEETVEMKNASWIFPIALTFAVGCGGDQKQAESPDTGQEVEEAGEAVGEEVEEGAKDVKEGGKNVVEEAHEETSGKDLDGDGDD
jgi:hypothetical protein